ncbi:MAG TPA: FAD-dependent oxidoreductase [Streptosporangiaceae bacterium]|nr:FAD-dependent oxidoreductase [Streptosporangiaceae bacterium]
MSLSSHGPRAGNPSHTGGSSKMAEPAAPGRVPDPPAGRLEADVLVVGGGPGGTPAAMALARAGRRVLLAEAGAGLGGTCLFEGCSPSKIFRETARRLAVMRTAGSFGITCAGGEPRVDRAGVPRPQAGDPGRTRAGRRGCGQRAAVLAAGLRPGRADRARAPRSSPRRARRPRWLAARPSSRPARSPAVPPSPAPACPASSTPARSSPSTRYLRTWW